jgi:hypothetical protein
LVCMAEVRVRCRFLRADAELVGGLATLLSLPWPWAQWIGGDLLPSGAELGWMFGLSGYASFMVMLS